MKICKGYRTGVDSPPIFINKKMCWDTLFMYVSGYVGATLMVSSTEITSFAKVKTFTICPFTEMAGH